MRYNILKDPIFYTAIGIHLLEQAYSGGIVAYTISKVTSRKPVYTANIVIVGLLFVHLTVQRLSYLRRGQGRTKYRLRRPNVQCTTIKHIVRSLNRPRVRRYTLLLYKLLRTISNTELIQVRLRQLALQKPNQPKSAYSPKVSAKAFNSRLYKLSRLR